MLISNNFFNTNTLIGIVFCCIPLTNIRAQKSGLNFEYNVGTSLTSPLKGFHKSLIEQISLDNFKTTENFYMNYGFSVGFTVAEIKSSFFYANRVSGAKTSVADYSGYLRVTNELKGHTIGYKYNMPIGSNPNIDLFVQYKALITFSKFNITSDSKFIGGVSQFDSVDFKSMDLGLGVGILYEYPIGFLVLRAYIDVDIYYGGKIKLIDKDVEDGFLLNANGKKLTTGWGGLTSGLGITIPL